MRQPPLKALKATVYVVTASQSGSTLAQQAETLSLGCASGDSDPGPRVEAWWRPHAWLRAASSLVTTAVQPEPGVRSPSGRCSTPTHMHWSLLEGSRAPQAFIDDVGPQAVQPAQLMEIRMHSERIPSSIILMIRTASAMAPCHDDGSMETFCVRHMVSLLLSLSRRMGGAEAITP